MTKLPMWQTDWEQAEKNWDLKAKEASIQSPIKNLEKLPNMPGITKDTAKGIKWKSLKWMIQKDKNKKILLNFLRHPFRYGYRFIKSALMKKPYKREGDFFLYGIHSFEHFEKLLQNQNSLFILGFSYCHKPFECPSGRFTSECQSNVESSICQQCFIGKAVNAITPNRTIKLFIPTIHYIGEKIFEIIHANPTTPIVFIITACELTLEMFGDWGNMVNIQGIGVRLDGRICNTMKSFELSEMGIKPGLTVILENTKKKILHFIQLRNKAMI